MNKTWYFLLISIGVTACSEISLNKMDSTEKTTSNNPAYSQFTDSVRTKRRFIPRFNYVDVNGLKQGVWITRGYKKRLKVMETFVNDTLHGYWFKESGGFQVEGYYEKGLKQGYFWQHRIEQDRLNRSADNFDIYLLYFYENNSIQWTMSPETDMERIPPVRGIMTNSTDSINVKAIYRDGSTWYEGNCVNGEPVGQHKIHLPNGTLLGLLDYDNGIMNKYDSLGRIIQSEELRSNSFKTISVY